MQVLGLAKIQLAEDFLSEGVWENLEIHEICAILVKSTDLVVIWPNKFLSGEFRVFRGKVVIIWPSPQVSRLFGQINSFLENFVFFAESGH